MPAPLRLLRLSAGIELVSLPVLLTNLATAHWPAVSSLMGPLHGCAYLLVITIVAQEAGLVSRPTSIALIPCVGALLALRHLTTHPEAREKHRTTAGPAPHFLSGRR